MSMKDLIEAWIIIWGLSYIITAIVAPNISEVDPITYGFLGIVIISILVLAHFAQFQISRECLGIAFLALSITMVCGAVVSWTGAGLWNVPFPNKELFQVSMALADFLSAVFMMLLAIDLFNQK